MIWIGYVSGGRACDCPGVITARARESGRALVVGSRIRLEAHAVPFSTHGACKTCDAFVAIARATIARDAVAFDAACAGSVCDGFREAHGPAGPARGTT